MHERSNGDVLGAIAKTRLGFAEALRNGDPEIASRVYTDGATLLAPSAELIRGRPAIESFWAAGIAAGVSGIDLQALQLKRRNGLAFEIGRYALRLDPVEGGTVCDRGKYVLVLERQEDCSWQWAVEMFNPERPPA